jgi:hypothetical protein
MSVVTPENDVIPHGHYRWRGHLHPRCPPSNPPNPPSGCVLMRRAVQKVSSLSSSSSSSSPSTMAATATISPSSQATHHRLHTMTTSSSSSSHPFPSTHAAYNGAGGPSYAAAPATTTTGTAAAYNDVDEYAQHQSATATSGGYALHQAGGQRATSYAQSAAHQGGGAHGQQKAMPPVPIQPAPLLDNCESAGRSGLAETSLGWLVRG